MKRRRSRPCISEGMKVDSVFGTGTHICLTTARLHRDLRLTFLQLKTSGLLSSCCPTSDHLQLVCTHRGNALCPFTQFIQLTCPVCSAAHHVFALVINLTGISIRPPRPTYCHFTNACLINIITLMMITEHMKQTCESYRQGGARAPFEVVK